MIAYGILNEKIIKILNLRKKMLHHLFYEKEAQLDTKVIGQINPTKPYPSNFHQYNLGLFAILLLLYQYFEHFGFLRQVTELPL